MSEPHLTFDRLVQLEPRLLDLLRKAVLVNDDADDFCANRVWADEFKPRLMQLVGWCASNTHPELNLSTAYDVAYGVIYAALPDCKNCDCVHSPWREKMGG